MLNARNTVTGGVPERLFTDPVGSDHAKPRDDDAARRVHGGYGCQGRRRGRPQGSPPHIYPTPALTMNDPRPLVVVIVRAGVGRGREGTLAVALVCICVVVAVALVCICV